MPTTSDVSLKDIAAAIADELQLSDAERISVSQVTVSVTYQVDRSRQSESDWMDEWYEDFKKRELVPSSVSLGAPVSHAQAGAPWVRECWLATKERRWFSCQRCMPP